jgi:hypothetical protein
VVSRAVSRARDKPPKMLAFAQDNGSCDEEEGLAKSGSVGSGFATSRSLVSVFQLRDPYRTAPSKIAMNVTASRVAGSSQTGEPLGAL